MNNHSYLVNKILLEITSKYPHCRVWKTHTGEAYTMESVIEALTKLKKGEISVFEFIDNLRRIAFGQVGQTDITGIMRPNGRSIFIEVKTGTGRLSKQQKAFRDMVLSMGGVHIECRSLNDLHVLTQQQEGMNL